MWSCRKKLTKENYRQRSSFYWIFFTQNNIILQMTLKNEENIHVCKETLINITSQRQFYYDFLLFQVDHHECTRSMGEQNIELCKKNIFPVSTVHCDIYRNRHILVLTKPFLHFSFLRLYAVAAQKLWVISNCIFQLGYVVHAFRVLLLLLLSWFVVLSGGKVKARGNWKLQTYSIALTPQFFVDKLFLLIKSWWSKFFPAYYDIFLSFWLSIHGHS
jgi:hypothetical protein